MQQDCSLSLKGSYIALKFLRGCWLLRLNKKLLPRVRVISKFKGHRDAASCICGGDLWWCPLGFRQSGEGGDGGRPARRFEIGCGGVEAGGGRGRVHVALVVIDAWVVCEFVCCLCATVVCVFFLCVCVCVCVCVWYVQGSNLSLSAMGGFGGVRVRGWQS